MMKKIFYTLLLLLIIAFAGVAFLVATETGLQFSVALAAKLIPGKLSYDQLQGKLINHLTIENLDYQHKNTKLHIKSLKADYSLLNYCFGQHLLNAFSKDITLHVDDQTMISHQGHIQISGNTNYQLAGDTDIEGTVIPKTILHITGTGDNKTLQLKTIQAKLLDGIITGNAQFTCDYHPSIKIQLMGTHLNLHQKWKNYTSDLNFTLNANSQNHRYNIDLQNLHGKLNRANLNGYVTIKNFHLPDYYIENLASDIHLNGNHLQLSGNIAQTWQVNWQWQLPHLNNFSPNLNGKLSFDGNITGKYHRPKITADLKTKDVFITTEEKLPMNITGNAHFTTQLKWHGDFKTIQLIQPATFTSDQINIDTLGLMLKNVQLAATPKGKKTLIHGQVQSDKGTLNLDGQARFTPILTASIHLQGNDVTLINNHEYQIVITPDFQIHYEPQKIKISGAANIPHANIQPKTFEDTVTLPDNAVIIESKTHETKVAKTLWQSNINITLGDDVHIKLYGLIAKMVGHLTIRSETGKLTTAKGQLKIEKGKYDAYGEQLKIERGTLNFLGGALDNPAINIRAIKNIRKIDLNGATSGSSAKTIAVGVQVLGLFKQPKITLFSEPAGLDDADILSYLMLGVPSNKASTAQAKLLMKAAYALGMTGGHIMEDLQQTFGLSEFGLESETIETASDDPSKAPTTQQNTAFVIGKYITPRLYMNYSVGLMVPINILKIKYLISNRLSIQSESSTQDNGVDLLYSFETD